MMFNAIDVDGTHARTVGPYLLPPFFSESYIIFA